MPKSTRDMSVEELRFEVETLRNANAGWLAQVDLQVAEVDELRRGIEVLVDENERLRSGQEQTMAVEV